MINTAKSFNKKVIAFITDMNQPLGNYIGNWLEVYESIQILQGKDVPDLNEVTFNLSGAMIYLGGKAKSIKEGKEISKELITSGKAFDKFCKIVSLQGGDLTFIKSPEKYPKTKFSEKIIADKSGYIKSINNYNFGMSALELGAGRKTKEDKIDPQAGIFINCKIGDKVSKGDILAEIYTNKKEKIEIEKETIANSIEIFQKKSKPLKLIKSIIK